MTDNGFSTRLILQLGKIARFDQLSDFWYRETNCPILVTNSSFSKITSSGLDKLSKEFPWVEAYLSQGCLPKKEIEDFAKESINSEEPTLVRLPENQKSLVAAGVHVRSERVLLITIIENDDLSVFWEPFQLLLKGASVIYAATEHHIDSKEVFLRDLVDGRFESEEQAQAYARALSIYIQKDRPVCILVGRMIEQNQKARNELCRHIMTELFPSSCALKLKDIFVVLVQNHTQVTRGSTSIQTAETYFRNIKAQFCICPPTHRFSVAYGQFREAKSILDLLIQKKKEEPIIYFEQIVFQFILENYSKEELDMLCIPFVKKMYETDLRNDTEYTLALCAYLLCYGNYSEIAEIMGISYNTAKSYVTEINEYIGNSFALYSPALFWSVKILGTLYPAFEEKCKKLECNLRDIKR